MHLYTDAASEGFTTGPHCTCLCMLSGTYALYRFPAYWIMAYRPLHVVGG
jgi:hypothetical protein